jgi:AcrR family transcriptional regulator
MVRAVAEKGLDDATVADVVERAKVGKGTFYEEFEGKDECVLAAYDWVIDQVMGRVGEAYEAGAETSWPEGVRSGLNAFLGVIAEQPAVARMATLEVPTAGPQAHARYRAAVERFLPYLRDGQQYSTRSEELPQHVDLMAVGGAEAIIFDEVAAGRAEQLPAMMPAILFSVLVPYLGPEDAAAEMHAAAGAV